jgi:hypothetical protein
MSSSQKIYRGQSLKMSRPGSKTKFKYIEPVKIDENEDVES